MKLLLRTFLLLNLTVLIWFGSAWLLPGRGSEAEDKQAYLNGGYFLLHQLCAQEAQLPLLLDVKHASTDVKNFADRISRTAKESNAALEQMQDADPALNFGHNPLPSFERDVRDSIQDEKQDQLLFGTSGAAFERALLVSQVEASNYAQNIAKVLAENEKNPERRKCLEKISSKWLLINKETFRLLSTL
jgi:hypothetical protein